MKTSSSTTTTRLEDAERRRHFHKLFRPQWFEGNHPLNSTYRKRQRGHFRNLLGNPRQRTAEKTEHFHGLFHHLQHWDGKSLHELKADATVLPQTPLWLGIPQDSPPRPRGWRLRSPWRVVRLALHPLSASAVMPGPSNSHAHGQAFVLPVAPVTSLTSPFCGVESTATIARDTMHVTSRVRQRKTQGKTKVSTVVVVVVCGGGGVEGGGGVGWGEEVGD